jgi:hypothetical protein
VSTAEPLNARIASNRGVAGHFPAWWARAQDFTGSRGWACRSWQARAWPPPSARQPARSQDISRMPWRLGPCCPSTARPPHRVEIGVEGRKVEVGVLCCFQRLFDTRGFGGDGVAEFAEHEAVVVPALLVIRKDRPLLSRCPQARAALQARAGHRLSCPCGSYRRGLGQSCGGGLPPP